MAVACIVRPHGLKGEVKVIQLSDDPYRIFSLKDIFIVSKNGEVRQSCVRKVRPVRGGYAVTLANIKTASDAQKVVGCYISVPEDEVPVLGRDAWYHFEIIGIEVFTTDGACLGKIEEIISTGSNDVYVVRDEEHEYLIPAIRDVIKEVDTKRQRMVIAVMDGLIEM